MLPARLRLSGGQGIIIARHNYVGLFSVGGPIEPLGRLRYIDGASDTLLISPTRLGDACLNHLHFPKRTSQTAHSHPSNRVTVVTRGSGRCVIPDPLNPSSTISVPLRAGNTYVIRAGGEHAFFTDDVPMDVIAFHPESDFGPQDDDHPMINRTIVDGVSANTLAEIKSPENTQLAGS